MVQYSRVKKWSVKSEHKTESTGTRLGKKSESRLQPAKFGRFARFRFSKYCTFYRAGVKCGAHFLIICLVRLCVRLLKLTLVVSFRITLDYGLVVIQYGEAPRSACTTIAVLWQLVPHAFAFQSISPTVYTHKWWWGHICVPTSASIY